MTAPVRWAARMRMRLTVQEGHKPHPFEEDQRVLSRHDLSYGALGPGAGNRSMRS